MARTALPVTAITRAGVDAAPVVSALAGHVIAVNDGRTFLEIVSTDGADQTVTIQVAQVVDGQAVSPKVVPVPAGATRRAGEFPNNVYDQTTAVAADVTLTSDGTAPANNDTVTADGHIYTFKTTLTEVAAAATLTSDATAPADADTVSVAGRTYTFKTTLTGAANEVLIGGSAANALINLKKAVNLTGVAGTDYGTGTTIHATVTAGAISSTTLVLSAKTPGTAGNAYASTETSAHLSFGGATFSGGVNPVVNEVLIGGSAAAALTNLRAAVNAGSGEGTSYSTGTVAHTTVQATTVTSTTLLLAALTGGVAGDTLAVSEASAHLSFSAATLLGGFEIGAVLVDPSVAGTLAITAYSL